MLQNILKSIALTLLILLSFLGCSTVSPAGLIAASRLDPLKSDAGEIAVAIGLPKAVQLSDGDAQFHFSFASETETVSETVPLRVRKGSGTGPKPENTEQVIYVADFSAQNAMIISSAQSRIKALKAAGVDGEGTISIGVIGGCITAQPLEELPVTTWLQTDPKQDFVRLTRTRDMLSDLPVTAAQDFTDNLRMCP